MDKLILKTEYVIKVDTKDLAIQLCKLGRKDRYKFLMGLLYLINKITTDDDKLYLATVYDEIRLIAEDECQNWHPDSNLCQEGECKECGILLRGWAKYSTCPVCGEFVYLT